MVKISLIDVLLVVVIVVLAVMFIWKIFGSSPSIEHIGLMLTIFFLILALESRKDSKDIKRELSKGFKEINETLKEIKEKI